MKYLGMNLIKDDKDLCTGNKGIKEGKQIKGYTMLMDQKS